MTQPFPPGWNEERARKVASHYEQLSEDEQLIEDEEAAREHDGQAVISVPEELLPTIRQILASFHTP